MVHVPGGWKYIFFIPPIETIRGTVCTHVDFWVAHREPAVLTNVGAQNDNIHIMDFLTLLYSVAGFCGPRSTPVQGISNIFRG